MSTMTQLDLYSDVANPLDSVEEIMVNNDWVYDRQADDELTVQISGSHGEHFLRLLWQEEFSAVQLCCMPDITIAPDKADMAAQTLQAINSGLWLGHFDLQKDKDGPPDGQADFIICFRQTSLFRGNIENSGLAHMEDVIDIALAECERYYHTLELLTRTQSYEPHTLALAMMETAGQS